MTLKIDDLGTVWEALYDVRSKAYNIGLNLKVPVGTLDSIMKQYSDPSDQLRETLKAWLKMATQQKWQTVVELLRNRTIHEQTLASDIEAEHCQGTPGQASGQATPRDAQIEALQQEFEQKLREQQRAIEAGQRQQQELKEKLQLMKQPAAQLQPNPPQQETTLMKLIWRDGPKAPVTMSRGSVATDGTTVYCNGSRSKSVHQYNSDTQQWSTLPDLPMHSQYWVALVMADNNLTTVGGYSGREPTNSLLSLMGEGRRRKWLQHFPPMKTKRYCPAASCHGRSLIVAGGYTGLNQLTTVEVLNMDTHLWSIASSLTHPFYLATASICGERLYLLGGCDETGRATHSVLTCSISKLLQSCKTRSRSTIWQRVADSPYKGSTGITLCGQLVAVGGKDEAEKATTAISAYDESMNSWLPLKAMKTPRCWPLVVSLHNNKMIVIGSCGGDHERDLDTVEVAKVS